MSSNPPTTHPPTPHDPHMSQALLEAGALPDLAEATGTTALEAAQPSGDQALIALLESYVPGPTTA